MNNLKIFVEHESHEKFIKDFIKAKYSETLTDKNFVSIQSREDIALIKNSFKTNSDIGGINIVILNNFIGARAEATELRAKKRRLGIEFDFFLFPDDSVTGTLETLLCSIISRNNKSFEDSFKVYSDSLQTHGIYHLPTSKCKIYAYLDAIIEDDDQDLNSGKQDYTNRNHWDIHHFSLQKLIEFWNKYFGNDLNRDIQ